MAGEEKEKSSGGERGIRTLLGIENTEAIDSSLRQSQHFQLMRPTIARYCTLSIRV
jgi:hypothetical protein